MRFSIKWALAAMAYVALAAAAIGANNTLLADGVWTVAILAFCYALIVACSGLGKRRQMALGFAVVWAAYVVCLQLAPDRAPSSRLLGAAGYHVTNNGDVIELQNERQPQTIPGFMAMPNRRALARTANAVGTMFAGLVGCGLGALAYRRGRSASD